MEKNQDAKQYKSPQRKLVKFFEKSRDKWKTKCKEARVSIKRLSNRVRFLETSKEALKKRVKELEAELSTLKRQDQQKEVEFEELKKTKITADLPLSSEQFKAKVPYHHYSIGIISLYIEIVLSCSASLRCTSSVIDVVMSIFNLPFSSPSWYSGRLWLLRLGYYKLNRPKIIADDWVWIIDHTVQIGVEKCLVILGVRLSCLPSPERPLKYEDVEPITLVPVKKSNQDIVYQQLESTVEKTGIPREIISDHGSDLKAGTNKFCDRHPETCCIYDIKHKTASVLKKELNNDKAWIEFCKHAAQTKREVQQTELAPLAPPNQRSKARYMNVDILVLWAAKMIVFLDDQSVNPDQDFKKERIDEKLGWLVQYRSQIAQWGELIDLVTTTESFIRKNGLHRQSYYDLKDILDAKVYSSRTKVICSKLLIFIIEESFKAKTGEKLVGSSDVIESLFGKLKNLEHNQAKSGFTGLLLSVAAMVSSTTKDIIRKSLEIVPTKKVLEWVQENLGQTLQSKRRKVFKTYKNTEQKEDQYLIAG